MRKYFLAATVCAAMISTIPLAMAKTLNFAHDLSFGAESNMDPIDGNRLYEAIILTYNRLVRPSYKTEEPEASLATSWSSNDKADVWTFKLRDGVTFHDGSAFGPEDVVYTFKRIIDPNTKSAVKAVLDIIKDVRAGEDNSVIFELNSSHADFPLLLIDYRARIIPEGSGDTIADTGIGTGPFKLKTLDAEGISEFVRFDDYWDGKPQLDGINVTAIADAGARQQALAAGQIDLLLGATEEQQNALGDGFNYQHIPSGAWRGIVFNTQSEEFKDWRVRKALRILADREQIIKRALGENGGIVSCDDPVAPTDPYLAKIDCPQDIEGAKALLAEAGHKDGLDIEVFTAPLDPTWAPLLEVYQAQAAKAGVKVKITSVPSDGFWNDVWMKKSATTTYWGGRPADQILNEAFRSGAKWNETYWNVPEFDAQLDVARSELDPEKRKEDYRELQVELFEKGGAFIPFHLNTLRVVAKDVTIPAVPSAALRWSDVTKN
ncbi:ABC transporter substrate-binding protein [Sneathiella sp.]|uniref:ABC transporter substrate-binding protein n=1 Tax=Sneathiella sp. TaxID=1964365 RepID=UPI00262213CD|nr:ABC transporter substrate-binding protein [Sneathiella sp.]MDF2368186.1 ABC transporter substrate-binding protein [Sneathiella sp.]